MTEERKAAERLLFRGLALVVALVAAFWLLPQVWDKLSPFIIAVPLAALLQPVIGFLRKRLKMKPGLASVFPVVLLVCIIIGFLIWLSQMLSDLLPQLVGQSGNLITEAVTTLRQAASNLLESTASNFSPEAAALMRDSLNNMTSRLSQWGSDAATQLVSFTVTLATSLPYGMIYLSFLAMALYFIAKNYPEIRSYLPGGKRRKQDSSTTRLTNSAIRSLMGYLRVQVVFAIIVFVGSLIHLSIFHFRYTGAISILAAIMEMIPMVGSGLLYIVMGIAFFLVGDAPAGFQVLALTGWLQLLRRLLEPKLMSDSIGISPLQSLIGMFVGLRFGGILGLIGGPVLMSVLVGAAHGEGIQNSLNDVQTLVQYFRRRWASPPKAVSAPEASSDPPGDQASEAPSAPETLSDAETPEASETASVPQAVPKAPSGQHLNSEY